MNSDLAVFILAGGNSTRMGSDKAFVLLEGRSLLARALHLSKQVTENVRIVGDATKFMPFAPAVEDIFRDTGPLGGIHAALRGSQSDLNLILAVDTPFLTAPLLEFLVTRARDSAATVTVPRAGRGLHPLAAVYRRQFTYVAEKALRERRYKIDVLFDPARTQIVSEEDLQAAGFSPEMFRNLNTPEDLAEAGKA